jgi:hypothetical protein
MPPSLLPSLPRTSPGSSTSTTPRAVPLALAPTDLPPIYSDEEELRDNYRGPHSDHPSVRVIPTVVEERSPSSNVFNDGMVSTFRSRSRSPGPSVVRDEPEGLRPQTYDQLSHSWWSEEYHVVKPKKKTEVTERTEALQNTRNVSNNLIPRWDSERVHLHRRNTFSRVT